MKSKLKQQSKKLLTMVLSLLMLIGMSVPGMQAFAKDVGGSSQTIHKVKFVTTPSDTQITVKDGSNKEIKPSKDDKNTYELNAGSYTYSASAVGYDSITDKSFKVEKNQEIKVDLVKKGASAPAMMRGKAGATRGGLSLDNVTIKSFKIIDVANGNKEIDYRTSDNPEYAAFSADPKKFSNAVCQGQTNSRIKLNLSIAYKMDNAIQKGDTLTIPARHGGRIVDFASKKLFDGTNHQLGTWEYKNGNVIITFAGDYIKNNSVKQFTASFETGEVVNYLSDMGKTTVKDERRILNGALGINKLVAAGEKEYVVAQTIGNSQSSVYKSAPGGSDSFIGWRIGLFSDFFRKDVDGKTYPFHNPYMLEHDGQYSPKALTDIFIEDTYNDCISEPTLSSIKACLAGTDDNGKIIAGDFVVDFPKDAVKKINQGSQTKEQVKNALKNGEYCMYDNHDGTYTLLMRWWNMNDSNGFTYDKIPAIKNAGGVGSYLKTKYPDLFGSLKAETIERINNLYKDKAIQNTLIDFHGHYTPVLEKTEVPNAATVTTKQLGEKAVSAIGILTPSAGIADAPADPLSIKMLKTDKDTGNALSTGFKFVLQTSTDNGATWTDVSVNASMLDKGTLDGGQLVPDDKGAIQVKTLIGGNMYRFVEKAHTKPYQDVTINNAKPNDKNNTTSANSRAVKVTNQGKGQVIVMYNAKVKTSVKVCKKWKGPEKDSVVIKLLKNGQDSGKTLTLTKTGNWEGTFKGLDKYNPDGSEIKYDIAEVKVDNYESTKAGDAKNGFVITNKHVPPKKAVFKGTNTTNIDGELVQPGQELTYAITYENTKGEDVKATITDKIPAHTTFVSADNGGTESGGVVTWKPDVAKGQSITVKVKVKVDENVNGAPLDNQAKVNDGKNEADTNETHNFTPTEPVKESLQFESTTNIDGKRVEPGQKITYAIKYKNTTGKDVDATITDKIPAHTKFVSAEDGGKESGGVVTWKKKVAKDDVYVAIFTVQVDQDVNGQPIKNKAKVNDGKNESDTNEVTNPTPTRPVKEVFKGDTTTNIDGKVVKGGDELTYAITYKNTTGEAVKTTITDKLPAHTTFVSADNGGTEKDGVVTWKADVADGKSVTVTFTVKVDKDVNGAPLDNQAKVNDGKNNYNTNETHNPTPTEPRKEVFKSGTITNIDGQRVEPGQKLTYAITYANTTGAERDVTITDRIPAYTSFVSADNGGKFAGSVVSGSTVTWTRKVAAGEIFRVTFTVKVDNRPNGATLTNKANVRDGVNDSDTNTVKNPTPKTPEKPAPPKTGDHTGIGLFMLLLLASGGALGTTAVRRRKRQ